MSVLLPIHILTYSYTLGVSIFYSFIGSKKAIETLPKKDLSVFQSTMLPIHFITQFLAPPILISTAPSLITIKRMF